MNNTGVWFSVKDKLPESSGSYVVAFSSKNINFDVDEFNNITNQWDFYSKDGMVTPKYWMQLPNIKKGVNDE